MGLGIYLTGRQARKGFLSRQRTAEQFLRETEAFFNHLTGAHPTRTSMIVINGEQPKLFVNLHPAGEDIEVSVGDRGTFSISAKTSGVGPGYHIHLCEALSEWGQQSGAVFDKPTESEGSDDTGYFFTRNRDDVDAEFKKWLGQVARILLENSSEDAVGMALSMSMDYSFDIDELVITPMGPRSVDWVRATAQSAADGFDIFPWREAGQHAGYHLGRAINRMWCDVRWTTPRTKFDRELQIEVLNCLESAYREDPTLNFPWREWHELIGYAGHETALAQTVSQIASAANSAGQCIGYRRKPVTVRHPGEWSIRIPGHFAEETTAKETWFAHDEKCTIYFSSLRFEPKDGTGPRSIEELLSLPKDRPDEPVGEFSHAGRHTKGFAHVTAEEEDDGAPFFRFRGYTATPGSLAICTIDLSDENDIQRAVDTWKSIDHLGPREE